MAPVNEAAHLKLIDYNVDWQNHTQFFGIAFDFGTQRSKHSHHLLDHAGTNSKLSSDFQQAPGSGS
jgi:hypothetical protein